MSKRAWSKFFIFRITINLLQQKPLLWLAVPMLLCSALSFSAELAPIAPEVKPISIELAQPLSDKNSEISALCWCANQLILVPQYTDFANKNEHYLYRLDKQQVLTYLDQHKNGLSPKPLLPQAIPVNNIGKLDDISGYQGLEAMVCQGDVVYFAIETDQRGRREATVIVKARWQNDSLGIESVSEKLPSFYRLGNVANESLLWGEAGLLSISEVNLYKKRRNPKAYLVDKQLNLKTKLPFATIPYRTTDVTALDVNNRFWAMNYQYRGDGHLRIKNDPIVERFGEGASHRELGQGEVVERLIELQWHSDGIRLTDTPPVYLELEPGTGRNWEGLVRLDDRGFLAATDKYPKTLLAFIPWP